MITGAQIRMARAYLRWSVKKLAEQSGVGASTVKRMELREGFPLARGSNIEAVFTTFSRQGLVFPPVVAGEVIVKAIKRPVRSSREK